ncbi:hypothetical protein DQ04_14481000 [Trypanosoma grayi]|uniref:hypothetical protein n=1 Tax=Trypanosoma grayi TaxID=71804 RepID=UPI0004F426A8|nr:hypothetical protein DQ04_14481000 [Trypanosoma grayi]KEG06348.1 hypothetical protein DQ04_14481000 [Trypanosoma grayi]
MFWVTGRGLENLQTFLLLFSECRIGVQRQIFQRHPLWLGIQELAVLIEECFCHIFHTTNHKLLHRMKRLQIFALRHCLLQLTTFNRKLVELLVCIKRQFFQRYALRFRVEELTVLCEDGPGKLMCAVVHGRLQHLQFLR